MSTPSPESQLAVAVDIGGTFTDIALHDASSGTIWRAKTPSVPSDPSQAFLTGIRLALDDAGRAAPSLKRVLHGTTVATNMILEGKGAKAALVTTQGFRHVLTIGRQDIPRRANYLAWAKPARPVPASRVFEVKERIGAGGATIRRAPALTALSGPAAGVVGARDVAETCGIKDLIAVDIGGTSADICLVKDGRIALTQQGHVGEWPLPLPMVDMVTIGAG